ncbi:MAG TPA: pyridoxal phosphate-dependent aminotransferase, partial [Pantanalinema sp.]
IKSRTVTLDSATGFAPSAATVLAALGPNTRMIVLSSPCNPTGRIWSAHELRALAEGLLNRPGAPVWVLSDEVYRELYYTPESPVSIAQLYPHALVANSLSKSNALTGLRLGWLLAPSHVMPAIVKVHQFITTAASTFSQVVAGEVFRTPGMLGAHRPHYAALRETLVQHLSAAGLDFVPPEGAFYCLVRLPEPFAADSIKTAYMLLDDFNVVFTPGKAFGAEGWLRLSWVSQPAVLAEGIARLGAALLR